MTQPPKQPENEPEGLTREFNFPKPWIKDYNPMLHGIKPGMGYEQQGSPLTPVAGQPPITTPGPQPGPGQAPAYPANQSAYPANQPGYPPNQPTGPAPQGWQGGQAQWNSSGVYGGMPEKQRGLPAWAWTLISAAVLIIILLILYFVILK